MPTTNPTNSKPVNTVVAVGQVWRELGGEREARVSEIMPDRAFAYVRNMDGTPRGWRQIYKVAGGFESLDCLTFWG